MGHFRIRFNDVSAGYAEQRQEIDDAVQAVLQRGDFINGQALREFEAEFGAYTGAEQVVGTSNGTSALHLALVATGLQPGDEVITTPMTFIATAEAITHAGAKVVFSDIDRATLNLDPRLLEQAMSPRTRAILFVHLHGNPTGILETREFAERHRLILVEDCAQAHGATVTVAGVKQHVGSIGAAAAYSFFPAKNLGAFGDAGCVTTSDTEIGRRVRMLANHGRLEKYLHQVEGFNYRMATLQAAVLRVKLSILEQHVEQRNRLVQRYREGLEGLPVRLQQVGDGMRNAYHLFVIHTDARDALQQHLQSHGIETGIHYPIALHRQPAYEYLKLAPGSLPVSERAAETTLSLPLYPQLPAEQVDEVCQQVRRFFRAAN